MAASTIFRAPPIVSEPAPFAARYRSSPRNRVGGVLFALAMVALIFLVMWRMGVIGVGDDRSRSRLVAINLTPPPPPEPAAGSTEKQVTAKVPDVKPQQPRVVPPPVVKPKVEVPAIIHVSRAEMNAWDISKVKRADAGTGAPGTGTGKLYGPGEAPGVGKLYNAEWYREPTHAELATYLPPGLKAPAWGMIACRTVDNYHVEDCRELDESPPGSGLARGLRRASWQLLVRPPRLDGKPMIGAWVRIKFTIRPAKTEAEMAEEVPGG